MIQLNSFLLPPHKWNSGLMRKSLQVSLAATFAAAHAVLYVASFRIGVWRSWAVYLGPVEGIILGPKIGFVAVLIGAFLSRFLTGFSDIFWVFGLIAEPFSVMLTGFLVRGNWKPPLAAFLIMLTAYFLHPYGSALPLWTILDVLFALALIYPAAKWGKYLFVGKTWSVPFVLVMISCVCIATDSLVRIFLLVPSGFYGLFPQIFGGFEGLYLIFVGSAVASYIEDLLVVAVALVVTVPFLASIAKQGFLQESEKEK